MYTHSLLDPCSKALVYRLRQGVRDTHLTFIKARRARSIVETWKGAGEGVKILIGHFLPCYRL